MGNCVPTRPVPPHHTGSMHTTTAVRVVVVEPVPPTTATRSIYSYGLDSPEYIEAIYPKPRREDFAYDSSYANAVQSREIAIDNHLDRCNGREVFDWY